MEYTVGHSPESCRFYIDVDGNEAYVEYEIKGDELVVTHTIVPTPLEGRGLASALVAEAYNYADRQGLRRGAICSYAKKWLEKHSAG